MAEAASSGSGSTESAILVALREHNVSCKVADYDHYRSSQVAGLSIETDYIIAVSCINATDKKLHAFDTFLLSKSFRSFRTLAEKLKQASDVYTSKADAKLSPEATQMAKYCESVNHSIGSQPEEYLGKVSLLYSQGLAKQRGHVINDVLEATCQYFPDKTDKMHPLTNQVVAILEMFFLTDHCEATSSTKVPSLASTLGIPKELNKLNPMNLFKVGKSKSKDEAEKAKGAGEATVGATKKVMGAVVKPFSRRDRHGASLVEDEPTPASSAASPETPASTPRGVNTATGKSFVRPSIKGKDNTMLYILVAVVIPVSLATLYEAGKHVVEVELRGDVALLIIFAAFSLGVQVALIMKSGSSGAAEPARVSFGGTAAGTPARGDRGRRLMQRMSVSSPAGKSVKALAVEEGDDRSGGEDLIEGTFVIGSPLPKFPEGATIGGSDTNCWSEPPVTTFHVRGRNYFKDKKKVVSEPYLFVNRGMDLFLTDECPENVGRNSCVYGGNLRQVPTLLVNFRLPWGVLLFHFEIPEKFVPFVRAGYEPEYKKKNKLPDLGKMSPAERATARFLMGDAEHKNNVLKFVPNVVDGPWVVKQAVGQKPAIIGTKLPITYVYQPPGERDDQALYLEADLDIAASSAARYILSVVRSYTDCLTIDLGFVIQGEKDDELPEQMMSAMRIHRLEPVNAPAMAPMPSMFMNTGNDDEDDLTE